MAWQWRDALRALLRRDQPDRGGSFIFPTTQAGQRVDEDRALRYSAIWACVRVISESIAVLPWQLFRKEENGRTEVTNDLAWMLQVRPNDEMSPFAFKELMSRRALLGGNAYAEIARDQMGRPAALWPILPERVCPERDPTSGEIYYRVNDVNGDTVLLDANDVFHLKGPGGDGIVGYSVIRMASEAIGLGLAMQEFGASFFGNGAHVGGALFHPKSLSDLARKNLEQSLHKSAGRRSALSLRVFEEGMKYERIGIPPEDAQFLESRNFQVRDIARWYRVPPHKIADLSDAKWANIEQQAIDFVGDAIVPWVTRIEQEANIKFFGRNNRGTMYTKLNVSALLRGDQKARYDSYAVGRQWGWLNANDVRGLEDMNPLPKGQGDQYLVPANMTTPDLLEKGAQQKLVPQPGDPQPDAGADKPPAKPNGKANGAAHHA